MPRCVPDTHLKDVEHSARNGKQAYIVRPVYATAIVQDHQSSRLQPQEPPVMIAERHRLFVFFQDHQSCSGPS